MQAFLPIGLAFLMFTVGMRLTLADLADVFSRPKGLFVGLASQTLALPILAILISRVFELPPPLATGLLIVAVAPGGITSNYVTHLAGGDVALSTGMTLVTSLLAGVTIPMLLTMSGYLHLASNAESALLVMKMGIGMFAMTAVPLLIGIVFRVRMTVFALRVSKLLDASSKLVFLGIVAATFVQNWSAMMENLQSVGFSVLALNVAGILTAAALGRASRLPPDKQLAIAIETGLQNVAMAIVVASALLGQAELAVPALIYAIVMNFTAVIIIFTCRFDRKPNLA